MSATDVSFPVEAGHIMLFARAIGDANPEFSNAALAADGPTAGIVAPPTFVRVSTHFDPDAPRPLAGVPWRGSSSTPSGAPSSGEGKLHAEEHYEYRALVRPGSTLQRRPADGRTWVKESRSGGRLTFTEQVFDFVDESGAVLVRSTSVAVLRGDGASTAETSQPPRREVGPEAVGASGLPESIRFPIGTSRSAIVVEDLTRTQIVQFAGASGDFNPLHTDEPFATVIAGYPGVIAHGMLTMAASGRVITDWFGMAALRAFGMRFLGTDWLLR